MKKAPKPIPKSRDEGAEREFWATHSLPDCFDTGKPGRAAFPKLKPSLKTISIRLPEDMLAELKTLADKRDIPCQSLAKVFFARQIARERASAIDTPRRARKRTSQKA